MLSEDVAYISESFIETFQYLGIEVFYIPLDDVSTSRNKFGEFSFKFHEDIRIPLVAMFSQETRSDQDLAVTYTGRINAGITVITTQLTNNGIVAKEKDAIDVMMGNFYQRFLITGFPKDPTLTAIFTKMKLTDIEHAFKK